ncbi:MAG: D-2-hydroxyacid dehydrogenase [Idiomarina sp.]|nr:D-2-hydroxyacid dehydrogenase [Idiomarina sp.]
MSKLKGVMLDAASLGDGVDFGPLQSRLSEFKEWSGTETKDVSARIADYDVVFTNKVVLDRDVLSKAKHLKLVCVLATGLNNVDLEAAAKLGIEVKNVQAYGTASVAQHTMMLMLSLATRLAQYQASVSAGEWQTAERFCLMQYPVMQLQGKHLVLVGHGELGGEVERLALAFGMQVHVAARPGKSDDPRPPLSELLPLADVVSLHCPLTDDTRDLLSREQLALCKPEVLIVNCARGGIVNERDAVDALREGRIGGLAVDVLTSEPPRDGNPLLDALHERLNLIVTPHSAWLSPEARQRIIELSATNLEDYMSKLG